MLFYTGLLLIVIAVSLDGFGVGVTYGMKKTKVPFRALLIIMLCSGVVVLLSMTIGDVLNSFISPEHAKMIGGMILIFIGLFSLINNRHSTIIKSPSNKTHHQRFHHFKTVLSTPDRADLDHSGVISSGEALLLGTALALDAFGAGLGAAIIGYSPFLTSICVAIMSGLFLFCGIQLGMFFSKNKSMQKLSFLPPLILISLGIVNLF